MSIRVVAASAFVLLAGCAMNPYNNPNTFCIQNTENHLVIQNRTSTTWQPNAAMQVLIWDEEKEEHRGDVKMVRSTLPGKEYVTDNPAPFRVSSCRALLGVSGPAEFVIS